MNHAGQFASMLLVVMLCDSLGGSSRFVAIDYNWDLVWDPFALWGRKLCQQTLDDCCPPGSYCSGIKAAMQILRPDEICDPSPQTLRRNWTRDNLMKRNNGQCNGRHPWNHVPDEKWPR